MMAASREYLGGFRRLAVIGSGAQGKVWKAECVEDVHGIVPVGTIVALKVKYEYGDNLDAQWQKTVARVDELKMMDHPNVVRYLGCFREKALDQEKHVIVQELLDGETLKDRLEALNKWNPGRTRLGLDVDEAIDIVFQIASGLGYTAGLGIFHRDVKPGNVFLCKDGLVKLIDFGVARQSDGTITEEGNIRGSWNYLAPDFADGVFRGDQQSDIFSVGVVLHEIITGRLPYLDASGDDMAAYFARWTKKSEVSPIRIVSNTTRLLLGIDKIFDHTLTSDRSVRYKNFAQLAKDVNDIRFVEQKNGDRTYRRLQFIGAGGFGEVFKAKWLECNIPVAVKMLTNADGAARFHVEAEVMKKLDDPCFTRFIDFFEDDGRAFLVMSFLDGMPGSSLRDAISRSKIEAQLNNESLSSGGLPKELVLSAFERYARALGLMHRHQPMIIHRDVKPSNLYFPAGHPERVAIMDFGIVRTGDDMTANGLTPCTFDYAPPEIITTLDRGGPGMDIFALGLCLYESLTGKMAYPRIASDPSGMIKFFDRCKALKPPVFDDPRVTEDPDLLRLLRRMTDPDVANRLTNADEVAVEIRNLFYRDVEGKTAETTFFDLNVDKTVAIDGDRLKAWFEVWKREHPVDEKRLMEMYREQWQREHPENTPVRPPDPPTPTPVRRKRFLLFFACMVLITGGAIFAWPYVQRIRHSDISVIEREEENRRLNAQRTTFEAEFDALLVLDPVDSRRVRLAEAARLLKSRVGECVDVANGKLYEQKSDDAVRFGKRLEYLGKAVVGIVRNMCDFTIEIAGNRVYKGETQRLEFAGGDVSDQTMIAAGYEPKSLPVDFDGKTLTLTNGDFVPAAVRVDFPSDMDASVSCLFEDKIVTNGLWLKPRTNSYQCVFRKRGFDDKARTFDVSLGKGVRLDELGSWTASPVEVTAGKLGDDVTCTVDGKPAKVKMSLVPGEHVVKYSRLGFMDLVSHFNIAVGTDRLLPSPSDIGPWKHSPVRVVIPDLEPGTTCIIDGNVETRRYRDLIPGKHVFRYERVGYVAQSNVAFIVALATPTNLPVPLQWVAEKVKVSIPKMNGIEAKLDGKVVSGTLLLVPDMTYRIEYTEKATGRRQPVYFFVRNNTPMVAPEPENAKWDSSPNGVPKPVSNVSSSSVPVQAREDYANANEYFGYGEYDVAFEWYYKAFKKGTRFSRQDWQNIEKAYTHTYDRLSKLIRYWELRPIHSDSHRNIDELTKQRSELIRKYREMKR